MANIIRGLVYVVGDHIDTDVIIPARYLTSMDRASLAQHAFEDLDPKKYPTPFLVDGRGNYQFVVAGRNFGCGSSREHAPIALSGAGVQAVVASSFARIFYRNAVNGGIVLPLESGVDLTEFIRTGEELELRVDPVSPQLVNVTQHQQWELNPFGPVAEIIAAGGLTAYNKARLGKKI